MTVSLKRRREIAQEAREFHEAYKLAVAYGTAGDTEMADFFMNSIKERSNHSPEERAWLLKRAHKHIEKFIAEDHERRIQGLPRPEYRKPQLH